MEHQQKNQVIIAGRLGRDPERKGAGLWKFSVAIGGGKKRDGSVFPADWHTVVLWPNHSAAVEGFKKGDCVEVHGRLTYPEWTSPNGTKRKSCEIVATEVMPISQEPIAPLSRADDPLPPPQPQPRLEITDADIPF